MITSTHNPKLQWIRRLLSQPKARREARAFVAEGVRLVEEAFQASWKFQLALWSDEINPRGRELLAQLTTAGIPCEQVDIAILQSVSDTQTPQGILAVVETNPLPLSPDPDFLLILDNLRDPGNLGTILRTASAAAVQGVLLAPGCADPFNPKVVRSAMGAHFHLPILPLDWPAISAYLSPLPKNDHSLDIRRSPMSEGRADGLVVFLTDSSGDLPYLQANFRAPLALIIGSEAEGAGSEARQLAQHRLSIPMPGHAESLNAAIAAAILMFEVVRQRTIT